MTSTSNNGPTRTGNSYIQEFLNCPRKHYWHQERGLVPKGEIDHNLRIGLACHEALEVWHTKADQQAAILAIENVIEPTNEHWGMAIATMLGYIKFDQASPLHLVVQEFETSIPIAGGYVYTMRIDGIANLDGKFYVVEHKTTSEYLSTYFRRYQNNWQVTGYLQGVKKEVGHLETSGIIINALQKPRKQKNGYGEPAYGRELVVRSEYQVEQFLSGVSLAFEEIDDTRIKEHAYPRRLAERAWRQNTQYCHAYNKSCEYLDLCKYGSSETILALYNNQLEKGGEDETE